MLARRSKGGKAKKKIAFSGKELEKDIDIDVATARISAPVTPSPDTGDFTQTAAVAPISQAQPEDIDPINEADLFLSFGRDVQAEEILKDALEKNPASNPIKLKLLSIYANRKDANSFSAIARQVQDSGDAAAWAQAAEIGRNLEPSNPMYGGTADEQVISAPMDQGMAERQQAAGLDFDLGFGEPTTISEAESAVESGESLDGKATATHAVDFDLGFGEPEAAIAAEDESTPVAGEAVATSDLDFDLGLGEEPSPPAAIPVEDFASTMVLKAPLGDKTMVMSPDDVHAAQETPMDFDITAELQTLEKPETEQAAASTSDLDDLVFDITATHPSPAAIVEEKPAEDVSAGTDDALGFTLDFPVTEEVEPAPAQAATKEAAGLDLSGISLDMAELASPASSAPAVEVRDARWHDVATKLDLAKAYQEMGDNAGAREILEEVLAEGDEQQCTIAKEMLQLLG